MDYLDIRELYNYGIKGQKWGVRRFQNEDGSLTSEGKIRYSKNEFNKAIREVNSRASSHINPIDKQPIDISSVKKRGKLTSTEAEFCATLANDLYDKAAMHDKSVTDDLLSTKVNMYGLNNRLKQPTSLAAKIGSIGKEKNVPFKYASKQINDSLRYTVLSDDDNFVGDYNKVKSKLTNRGYKETVCKNYFDSYKNGKVKHKSVTSVFTTPDGFMFEIQFQTPSSQAAKELKTPLYEEIRNAGVSSLRRDSIEKEMINLAEKVDYPKDIFSIKSHN